MDRRSICVKKKMRPVTRLCIWGKRQKKSAKKNILGSRRPPFPSPQSTARPSNFFYPVSLRFFAIFFPHSRAWSQSTMDWTHSCTYKSLKQYEKEWRNIPEQDMFHKTQISRWFWWSANTHWEHSGKKKTCAYIRLMYAVLWLEVVKKMMFLKTIDRHYTCM